MKLKRIFAVVAAVVLLVGLAAAQRNTPEAKLRAAMDKETVDGDLKAAIEGYKQLIAQKGAPKEVVAQALLRLGMAYEKQGSAEATKQYERIVKEFGDQPAVVAQARARMAAGSVAAGPTVRTVCTNDCKGKLSPDGRWLVDRRGGALVVQEMGSKKAAREIVEPPKVGILSGWVISPDGKTIAYSLRFRAGESGQDRIYIVGVDGGPSRQVFENGWPLAWAPDGARLLIMQDGSTSSTDKMSWMRIADGAVQPLPGEHYNLDVAEVSPDGKYVAFNSSPDLKGDEAENVYIIAADGSGTLRVSPSPVYQEPVGWTVDGKNLIYDQLDASRGLWVAPVSGGKLQGPPVRTSRQMEGDRASAMIVTADGRLYYRSQTSASDIYTASMDPVTGRVTSLPVAVPTPASGNTVLPGWTLDSRRLLYQTSSTSSTSERELHLISPEDGKHQRLASGINYVGGPRCWTPDGTLLLNTLTSAKPRRESPARMDLNTGDVEVISPGASTFRMQSCSATLMAGITGTAIVVRNIQSGADTEIYKVQNRLLPLNSTVLPLLSHDGTRVVLVESVDENTSALRVVPSAGGAARDLLQLRAPAEFQPAWGIVWSPDDKFVYFLKRANANAPDELYRIPAAGGREEAMGLSAADIRDLNIAPDGRHIAFSIGSVGKPEIWSMENFLP